MTFRGSGVVSVLGAPVCAGQTAAGVAKAPEALLKSGLEKVIRACGYDFQNLGCLNFDDSDSKSASDLSDEWRVPLRQEPSSAIYSDHEIKKMRQVGSACQKIAQSTYAASKRGEFVLTIGGDHGLAAGSIAGILKAHPDVIVIWVDAHADINTPETSGSKNYHGMPVAHLLNWFPKGTEGFEYMKSVPVLQSNAVGYLGLRDVDKGESKLLLDNRIALFSMNDITEKGLGYALDQLLMKLDPESKRPIHLSFDIDACDPTIAPGTGTRARGGLTFREAAFICTKLNRTGRLRSMDLVEINPDLDETDFMMHGDNHEIEPSTTKTVRLGLELISFALGAAPL